MKLQHTSAAGFEWQAQNPSGGIYYLASRHFPLHGVIDIAGAWGGWISNDTLRVEMVKGKRTLHEAMECLDPWLLHLKEHANPGDASSIAQVLSQASVAKMERQKAEERVKALEAEVAEAAELDSARLAQIAELEAELAKLRRAA